MMSKAHQFRLMSVGFWGLALLAFHSLIQTSLSISSLWSPFLKSILIAFLSMCGWVCSNISQRHPSDSRTCIEVLALWAYFSLMTLAIRFHSYIIGNHSYAKRQEGWLSWCLKLNSETQYIVDHGLANVKTVEEFRARHPLTSYQHYRPYVDRCLNGETNIMFSAKYPVDYFAWTSGTSGKNKVYPCNRKLMFSKHSNIQSLWFAAKLFKDYSPMNFPLEGFAILVPVPNYKKTQCDVDTGTILGMILGNQPSICATPPKAVFSPRRLTNYTEHDFYYVSAIFCLQEPVSTIIHGLASSAYVFYVTLESEWESICDDIATGLINDEINIDPRERTQLESLLKPNPVRADELRNEFRKGMKAIVGRVWPRAKCISCTLSGSFRCYSDILSFYFGDVRVFSVYHASTEGGFGFNCWPEDKTIRYALGSTNTFFEFIAEDDLGKDEPSTVLPQQVEVGKSYEMVITTAFGLYRYRLGDVVEIVDFYEDVPVYTFKYRIGQMLNAFWEKTPESSFLEAINMTVRAWGDKITLRDFAATENINCTGLQGIRVASNKKGYKLFVEVLENTVLLTEQQKEMFDDSLRKSHELYDIVRGSGSLEPMDVYQCKPGTFSKLREMILGDNERASACQFKMPRAQRSPKYLNLLWRNVVE